MKRTHTISMKTAFSAAVAAVFVCVCSFALFACNMTDYTDAESFGEYVSVTISAEGKTYFELTKRANLHDLFLDMKAAGEITAYGYDEYEGEYYINAFGTLQDGGGKIVVVYHDLQDDTLYTENRFKKLDGVSYRSSAGMAVSKIPISTDAHYFITLEEQ